MIESVTGSAPSVCRCAWKTTNLEQKNKRALSGSVKRPLGNIQACRHPGYPGQSSTSIYLPPYLHSSLLIPLTMKSND